jgi:hypothetical protein
MVGPDSHQPGCVDLCQLDAGIMTSVADYMGIDRPAQPIFRVTVVEPGLSIGGCTPDVSGHYQIFQDSIRFLPHFPFERGVKYRARFDPRPLAYPELSDVLTLEFSFPLAPKASPTEVKHVYPSGDCLPENLLRFYVVFSNPMQRGQAKTEISLLDQEGEPVADALYRAPIELWDRSMRCLTVLLDPGRLKRGVGPNRELGPPLTVGREYTLVIDSGMIDGAGHPLRERFFKRFLVTGSVRDVIAVKDWKVVLPNIRSHQPLALIFPKPLDWAMLWHGIVVESEDGQQIKGRVAIDECERRWNFVPTSPWATGAYFVRAKSNLEDVCGNNLLGAFDKPLHSASNPASEVPKTLIPFQPV